MNRYDVNTTNTFQLLNTLGETIKNKEFSVRDEIKNFKSDKLPVNLIVNPKEGGFHWSCFHFTNDGKNIGLIRIVYLL